MYLVKQHEQSIILSKKNNNDNICLNETEIHHTFLEMNTKTKR